MRADSPPATRQRWTTKRRSSLVARIFGVTLVVSATTLWVQSRHLFQKVPMSSPEGGIDLPFRGHSGAWHNTTHAASVRDARTFSSTRNAGPLRPFQSRAKDQPQANTSLSYAKSVVNLNTIDDKERLDRLKAEAFEQSKAYPLPPVFDPTNASRVIYNPEVFRQTKDIQAYVNLPIPCNINCTKRLEAALALSLDAPVGLKHKAHPPGKDVVMGLAAYPRGMDTFQVLVGSLRATGYDGHIILGVHANIPPAEEEYLQAMDVTYYTVNFTSCDPAILTPTERQALAKSSGNGGGGGNLVRAKCSTGLEKLKLEWGRFEMSRQWLQACTECTGWAMTMDTRDAFFQSLPFAVLGEPTTSSADLYFVEEIGPHTDPFYKGNYTDPFDRRHFHLTSLNKFYKAHTESCYGKKHYEAFGSNRPVLCSGTVIGNRQGLHRFLSVLVDEFHYLNKRDDNPRCKSPSTTDQWIMNYLYYSGRFGLPDKTKTLPFGTGPVATVGKPCINRAKKPNHSAQDIVEFDSQSGILIICSSHRIVLPTLHLSYISMIDVPYGALLTFTNTSFANVSPLVWLGNEFYSMPSRDKSDS